MKQTEDGCAGINGVAQGSQERSGDDPRLARAMEEYQALRAAGEKPDHADFLARFPEVAGALADCLSGLDFLHAAAPDLSTPATGSTPSAGPDVGAPLGDFRLIREVGRGGMGIVYEAEQMSLGRRVALKVLPFAATMDPRHLQRFHNEARAVASLHHEHIVPVYAVGCERGVHYYGMQFIEGQTVAQLIADQESHDHKGAESGGAEPRPDGRGSTVLAAATTQAAPRDAAHFRRAAEWGIQAAQALEHAHALGIVHRDIKPANLIVDGRGKLWVADFGLARTVNDAGLTMTGDLLGTLRYMSPEQALAKHGLVDHRTDIYSLGATLYELLTGRPAVEGRDRQEILKRIADEEPRPPRALEGRLPTDLETILLKTLAKEPAERYATAQELADDLQRFLDNKPVRARRIGFLQRLVRWGRRRPLAVVLIAFSLLSLLGAITGLAWHTATLSEALAAVQEREGRLKEAVAAAEVREREVRAHLYVADLHLGHEFFWKNGAVAALRARLDRHVPGPKDADTRDFAWNHLDHLARTGDARALRGHEGEVLGVAFAPDGRTVASAGADGTVRLWDPETLRPRAVLRGHQGAVRALAFAPDAQTLATTGDDGTIRLWDPADAKERREWPGHPGGACCLAFSPDGKRLASGGRDSYVRLWDAATGRELDRVPRRTEITALAFLGDGAGISLQENNPGTGPNYWVPGPSQPTPLDSRLFRNALCLAAVAHTKQVVAGFPGGDILLYDLEGPGPGRVGPEPQAPVRALAVSPDGRYLAFGGDATTVSLWDSRQRTIRFVGKGHEARVWGVAFAPDGRQIASASADGTVRLWDWHDPQDYDVLRPALEAAGPAAFAADGRTIALTCRNGTVRILDPATWQERSQLAGQSSEVRALALAADGRMAATSAEDRTVRLWDASTGRQQALARTSAVVDCLAFSPDSTLLALGGHDGSVWLRRQGGGGEQLLVRLQRGVNALAFSPNGSLLAISTDTALMFWNLTTGKEQTRLSPAAPIASLAFTRDGRTLLSTWHGDMRLAFCDTANPQVHFVLTDPVDRSLPHALAMSPDDRLVAVAVAEYIDLVNVVTHQVVYRLFEGRHEARALGFCLGGRRLVSVGSDGKVRSWDLASWTLEGPADQPPTSIRALAFTPDGRTLVTGSHAPPPERDLGALPFGIKFARTFVQNRTPEAVRLWDPATGRQHAALPLPVAVSLHCLALSADGRTVAAGCSAGAVRLWDLPSGRERLTLFTNGEDQVRWRRVDALLKLGLPIKEDFQTAVQAVAFAPDGRLLATANSTGRLQLWDAASGREVRVLGEDYRDTLALAFAPNGATVGLNRGAAVEVWDVATGQRRQTLQGHRGTVLALAYSADGRLLASAGQDREVRLWDPMTGRAQGILVGHGADVSALAFAPDGRTLASGGHDQVVRLWHLATGQELLALTTNCAVNSVTFSPDGRTLAGGGDDGSGNGEVFLWRAPGLPAARSP